MKIALTGANGFVGNKLKNAFNDYIVIDRDDTVDQIINKLINVDVVINLAGAPILKKWTTKYKKVLFNSRIETTKKLVKAINKSKVKHFISTSAIGIYPNNVVCDEYTLNYENDFLSNLVENWEKEAKKANVLTTILRFGIVLGADGGALKQMLLPFKLGLGGIILNGQMKMSFIDIDDLINLYHFVIKNHKDGVYNACSPHPITNYEFTKTLGKVLNRPTIFPLPKFILELVYAEASTVLIDSKEVYPKRLENSGFTFKYPKIKNSLIHLLK